jgi:MFS family permease
VGAAVILIQNLTNSLIQSLVSDQLRGRVMSIYTTILFGVFPLGGLLAGAVAETISEPFAVMLGAAVAFGYAILIWIAFPRLRHTH